MVTRWAMPPDSWKAYRSRMASGWVNPTCVSFSRANASLRGAAMPSFAMLSNIWRRMLLDGSRNSCPFCGIYTISRPSMDRSFLPFGKAFPQNNTSPETSRTLPGSTPITDWAISVLPDPVSPMRARLSPREIWKETPWTSSFSVRSSFAAITPPAYCKIGVSKCSSEPVLLCIPALRKDAALSSPRNAAPLLWVLAGMRV